MLASYNGHAETTRMLLAYGADVDADNGSGMTPLAFAAMFGRNPVERIFRFLDEEARPAEVVELIATLPRRVFIQTALRHYGTQTLGLLRGTAPKAPTQTQGTSRQPAATQMPKSG